MLKLQKNTLLSTITIPKTMILPISNDNKTEIKKNMKEKNFIFLITIYTMLYHYSKDKNIWKIVQYNNLSLQIIMGRKK